MLKTGIDTDLVSSNITVGGRCLLFHDLKEEEYNSFLVSMFWQGWHSRNRVIPGTAVERLDTTIYRIMSSERYMELDDVCARIEVARNRDLTAQEVMEVVADSKIMQSFAANAVQPLLVNYSMLSPEQEGITHFTCINIRDDELPWNQPHVVE